MQTPIYVERNKYLSIVYTSRRDWRKKCQIVVGHCMSECNAMLPITAPRVRLDSVSLWGSQRGSGNNKFQSSVD